MLKKRNLFFLSLLILGVLLITSCLPKPPISEGILKGQVMVPEGSALNKDLTGQALPDATIKIIDLATDAIIATTVTDSDGYYQVSVPAGGPYLLEAVKDGVKVQQFTPQVEVGIEYDLGTADCSTTAVALIAQAMMDAGDNTADIDCADIIADSNFNDVSSIVCSTIEAGGDPTASAAVLQAVEDFLSPPEPNPTPSPSAPTYTVTFNSQGGSAVSSQTVEEGAKASEPEEPARTDHTFSGWYKESACINAWVFDSDTVTADVTLYAQWTVNSYTVTFDKNGGNTEADPKTKKVNYNEHVDTLPTAPTRTGYTFANWNTEVGGGGDEFTATTPVVVDITVYAQWTVNSYTVTFDKNGGNTEAAPTTKTATHGDNVGSLPIEPTRTDYNFIGWNAMADDSGDEFTVTTAVIADITVYAQWTKYPVYNSTQKIYYTTVQPALDEANANDTIEVADGTYYESIVFPSNNIILKSASGNPNDVIIQGENDKPTVKINDSADGTKITGFTIKHNNTGSLSAYTISGRGIVFDNGNLTVDNCVISSNFSVDYSGGGIDIHGGTLTITNSTISGNSTDYSGGGIQNSATLTITNSTISGNSAANWGGIDNNGTLTITNGTISGNEAGGIYNHNGTINIANSIISSNSVNYGSGIENNGGTITITGSTVSNNEGSGIKNNGTFNITNTTISNNSANSDAGGIQNGGTLTITGSTISGNHTFETGGGIQNVGTLTITNSTISGNIGEFCAGGIYNGGTLTITGSTISGNFSANCGGVFLTSEDNVIIGGDSDTDFDNFNNFINNLGVDPSGQHIRKFVSITDPTPSIPDPILITIDCHTNYPNNNFTPGP